MLALHSNLAFCALALGLSALMVLSGEAGFALGRRTAAHAHPKAFDNAMSWEGAVLGLAALLIGFTFAMAVTRFDSRRQVLIAEANAIGTTYHRTELLERGVGDDVRQLLRRYIDVRLALYDVATDPRRTAPLERASSDLQHEVWSRLAAVGRADPRSITNGLVLQAASDMIERAVERRSLREVPVPPTVFLVVVIVSAIAVASIGYALGITGTRMRFGMLVIPLLVAVVLVLVIDIAHPSLGVVRVPDLPMLRLRQSL